MDRLKEKEIRAEVLKETQRQKDLKDLEKYKKGFDILIEYFDSISDEEKPEVHKQLNKLGL